MLRIPVLREVADKELSINSAKANAKEREKTVSNSWALKVAVGKCPHTWPVFPGHDSHGKYGQYMTDNEKYLIHQGHSCRFISDLLSMFKSPTRRVAISYAWENNWMKGVPLPWHRRQTCSSLFIGGTYSGSPITIRNEFRRHQVFNRLPFTYKILWDSLDSLKKGLGTGGKIYRNESYLSLVKTTEDEENCRGS